MRITGIGRHFYMDLVIAAGIIMLITQGPLFGARISASFTGTINGRQAKSFAGEVAIAGSRPYLLISVKHQNKHWMFDFSGVRKKTGPARLSLSVMEYRGRKMLSNYSARKTLEIKRVPGKKMMRSTLGTFIVKNRKGKSVTVSGRFTWDTAQFPPEPVGGALSFYFGRIKLEADSVKVKPWNKGFQISKLFVVKPGETLTCTVKFPSLKSGTFKGTITIMHFWMVSGAMKSEFLSSKDISVSVRKDAGFSIRFNGTAKGKGKSVKIKGEFKQ